MLVSSTGIMYASERVQSVTEKKLNCQSLWGEKWEGAWVS